MEIDQNRSMPAWEAPGRLRFRPVKKARSRWTPCRAPSFRQLFPLADSPKLGEENQLLALALVWKAVLQVLVSCDSSANRPGCRRGFGRGNDWGNRLNTLVCFFCHFIAPLKKVAGREMLETPRPAVVCPASCWFFGPGRARRFRHRRESLLGWEWPFRPIQCLSAFVENRDLWNLKMLDLTSW
jgi:hypothetical protein